MTNQSMSKKGRVVFLLLQIIAGTMLFQRANASTEDIVKADNQARASFISKEMNYNEYGDGRLGSQTGLLDSENGRTYGLKIGLSLMSDQHYGVHHFLNASASLTGGNMAYTGQSLTSVSLSNAGGYGTVRSSHGNTTLNLDAAYGVGIDFADSLMIGPIVELGYRNWYRNINSGETYTNNYVAAGLFVKYSPINKLVFSGTATSGNTQSSSIKVAPMPVYGGFTGRLGNSSIQRFSLASDYGFTDHIHGHVGIDSTHYNYGASASHPAGPTYQMWEPRSTTVETVTSIGLGYAF